MIRDNMFITGAIVIISLLVTSSTSVLSEEAFDFYVEACRHSGYNPEEISTFQAELTLKTKIALPNSHADKILQNVQKTLEKNFSGNEVEKQKIIESQREIISRTYSGKTVTRHIKTFVKNSCVPVGVKDDPAHVLEMNLTNKEVFLFSIGTKIFPPGVNPNDVEKRTDLFQLERLTTIGKDRNGGGGYYLNGRIRSSETITNMNLLLSRKEEGKESFSEEGIAKLRKRCAINEQTFRLSKEREKYEGDHYAYILDIYEKGLLRERMWIDPDRGYICPREQSYNSSDGKIDCEYVSEKFIFDEHSQRWFPEKSVCKMQMGKGMESVVEVHVVSDSLILNQPIPDSVFSLTVQHDTRVEDTRRKDTDKITFFANQTGKLDLPTVEKKSLDEIPWLSQREVARSYLQPIEKAYFSWIRITFMTTGIILIVLGLYLRFFKKK